MAARKPFLLRVDPAVLAAVEAWAADDLRSVNAQIEFLLREALRKAGRTPRRGAAPAAVEPTAAEPATTEAVEATDAPVAAAAPAPKARRGAG